MFLGSLIALHWRNSLFAARAYLLIVRSLMCAIVMTWVLLHFGCRRQCWEEGHVFIAGQC